MANPVYAIFEGGGAKGLAHIAGVAAAEKSDLEFVGVAGASAGALIAALVAVGYRANELFDPDDPGHNILAENGLTPLSLVGEEKWAAFAKAGAEAERALGAALRLGALWARLLAPEAAQVAEEIRRDDGFFSTDKIRHWLNVLLWRKLMEYRGRATKSEPQPVTFKDMDPEAVENCCSLKIIVTDLTNRRPVVFDNSDRFKNVVVAEAVAASISIPFVFKPARIPSYKRQPNALYADGGMVSNSPIWVFGEEKRNLERKQFPNTRIPILSFTLADPADAAGSKLESSLGYFQAVAKSAVFGGQEVAARFVDSVLSVPMPIAIKTTEFDFSQETALAAYRKAFDAADRKLTHSIRIRPSEGQQILAFLHDQIINSASAKGKPIRHLRISIIKPFETASFRIIQSFNMDGDADDHLVFGNETNGAAKAFASRAPAFLNFKEMFHAGRADNMTKYEFALLRKSLQSAICFPIFLKLDSWNEPSPERRPQPLGVVSIDSDEDLAHIFADAPLLQSIAVKTVGLAGLLSEN